MRGERQRIEHGRAVVSWGKPFYGEPQIVANAPVAGIDDLVYAISVASDVIKRLAH